MRGRGNEAAALSRLHGLSHCRLLVTVRLHQRFFMEKEAHDIARGLSRVRGRELSRTHLQGSSHAKERDQSVAGKGGRHA